MKTIWLLRENYDHSLIGIHSSHEKMQENNPELRFEGNYAFTKRSKAYGTYYAYAEEHEVQ